MLTTVDLLEELSYVSLMQTRSGVVSSMTWQRSSVLSTIECALVSRIVGSSLHVLLTVWEWDFVLVGLAVLWFVRRVVSRGELSFGVVSLLLSACRFE